VDFAWDHKKNAENRVLTIIESKSNNVILSQVIQRCPFDLNTHNKHTCDKGYHGTSKGMEKHAVQETFQWLSEYNIHISTIIHDKDSSIYAAANNAYPNITE
jgi:hypothetical protein